MFKFDYSMFLGHNFKEAKRYQTFNAHDVIEDTISPEFSQRNIVNGCTSYPPSYNGFSINEIVNSHSSDKTGKLQLNFHSDESEHLNYGQLGALMVGNVWDSPVNCDVSASVQYNYGSKQKKTVSGKTISKMNYYKTNKWLLDPWQLESEFSDTRGVNRPTRSGVRSWRVSFSLFDFKYAMNQWNFINKDIGFQTQTGYSETNSDVSQYSILNSIDFYTMVVNRSLESHLPFVIQIDATDSSGNLTNRNADTFAIVRMKDYKISQTNPKFAKISMTLEEQV